MKNKKFETVSFMYNEHLLPAIEEAKRQFTKETMITLEGISWKIEHGHLVFYVTEPQQEKWLFHFAFTFGIAYAKMKEKKVIA